MKSSEIAALPPEERRKMAIREKLKGRDATDIVLYFCTEDDSFDLTEHEAGILRRWEFAKAQFLDRKTYTEVYHLLMEEFGISVNAARVDISNMKKAFGQVDEVPKLIKRQVAERMAIKAFEMAEKDGNPEGMAKATIAYIKANNLDKEEQDKIDIQKLMDERLVVTVLDPNVRNLLLNIIQNSGGVTDASKLFEAALTAKNEEFTDFETLLPDEHERANPEGN